MSERRDLQKVEPTQHHLEVTVGEPDHELEPLSSGTTEFIDLATARVAVLSGNRIVSVSPLVLLPGAKAGFRAVFQFEPGRFEEAVTFDGLCFLDPENRPHGRTPLDGTPVDVHRGVTEVVVDLQLRVNLGGSGEVDMTASNLTVNGEGEAASGRIGKRRLALPGGHKQLGDGRDRRRLGGRPPDRELPTQDDGFIE